MRDFAVKRKNRDQSEKLLDAIHGRGAFRYFKDLIQEMGLADQWYSFRDDRYREIAMDWCEHQGLQVVADSR